MTYIAFTDEKKSDIVPKILNELTSFSDNLISIDKNYKVRISQIVLYDPELHKQLKPYAGMKIHLPRDKNYHPDRVCLQYKKDQFDVREN